MWVEDATTVPKVNPDKVSAKLVKEKSVCTNKKGYILLGTFSGAQLCSVECKKVMPSTKYIEFGRDDGGGKGFCYCYYTPDQTCTIGDHPSFDVYEIIKTQTSDPTLTPTT